MEKKIKSQTWRIDINCVQYEVISEPCLIFFFFFYFFTFFFLSFSYCCYFFPLFFCLFLFFFSSLFFSFSFYFEIRRKNDWLKMKGNKNDKGLNDTTLMSKESKTQNWWWFFLFFISIRRWKGNKIDKGH